MKLDRLLSIVIMLLNRKRVQAKDLAAHFEVSVRTIYRDVDAINRAGIPIVTYQGNKGGLGIIDSYKLDRQVLSLKDMVSMLSVLKGINTSFKDRQLNEAIEKIHALVPPGKRDYVKNYVDQVVIDVMPWGIKSGQKEKLLSLQQAIANNRLIEFSYRDGNGTKTRRTVEPMTMIFKATAWYLFAYCKLRSDFRLFRLTRIKRFKMLQRTYIRRVADYKQYDDNLSGQLKMIKLVIKFSRTINHHVEDYFDDSFLTYLKNGDVIATIELPENDWVLSYLLSLGEHAEVIKPKRMRLLLKEKAKKIIALYKHDIQLS
jgi:predicted DNA-binding transcriptional regulator YafY